MSSMGGKGILSESIEALRRQKNPGVVIFYSVLLILYLWIFAMGSVPEIQSVMMKKFHPGTIPFHQWAVCQFIPSMYNFKNEVIISPRILPMDFHEALPKDALKFSVNHYPMRILYFSNVRAAVYTHLPVYVYLRNIYRDREIVTSYIIEKTRQGAQPVLLNLYERVYR